MIPHLPKQVQIVEVGPRDGLQNEPDVVPADVKVEFIRRLIAAGVRNIEATSFVNPRVIPQLADAEEVIQQLIQAHYGSKGGTLKEVVSEMHEGGAADISAERLDTTSLKELAQQAPVV